MKELTGDDHWALIKEVMEGNSDWIFERRDDEFWCYKKKDLPRDCMVYNVPNSFIYDDSATRNFNYLFARFCKDSETRVMEEIQNYIKQLSRGISEQQRNEKICIKFVTLSQLYRISTTYTANCFQNWSVTPELQHRKDKEFRQNVWDKYSHIFWTFLCDAVNLYRRKEPNFVKKDEKTIRAIYEKEKYRNIFQEFEIFHMIQEMFSEFIDFDKQKKEVVQRLIREAKNYHKMRQYKFELKPLIRALDIENEIANKYLQKFLSEAELSVMFVSVLNAFSSVLKDQNEGCNSGFCLQRLQNSLILFQEIEELPKESFSTEEKESLLVNAAICVNRSLKWFMFRSKRNRQPFF